MGLFSCLSTPILTCILKILVYAFCLRVIIINIATRNEEEMNTYILESDKATLGRNGQVNYRTGDSPHLIHQQ